VIENILGLLGIVVFIACVIALAATVTWAVVRISPKPGAKKNKPVPAELPTE
jgi:hypothetical protein